MSEIDTGGGYARVGAEGTWKISALPSHFCCKSKTALKKLSITKTSIPGNGLISQSTVKRMVNFLKSSIRSGSMHRTVGNNI